MEAPKTKSISQVDVIAYFRAAPLEVLDELLIELEKCIERRKDGDVKVGIIQSTISSFASSNPAFLNAPIPGNMNNSNNNNNNNNSNSSKSANTCHNQVILQKPQPPVKTTSYINDSGSTTATNNDEVDSNSTRSRLMGIMNMNKVKLNLPNVEDFQKEMEAASKDTTQTTQQPPIVAGSNFEVYDATLLFVYGDNYNDGLFAVRDQNLKDILQRKKDESVANGTFFPFGYGKDNDLLKIKGFVRPIKGEVCRIKIKLQSWNKAGKIGYTCYKQD